MRRDAAGTSRGARGGTSTAGTAALRGAAGAAKPAARAGPAAAPARGGPAPSAAGSAVKGGARSSAAVVSAANQAAAEDELAQEELVAISTAKLRFNFDQFEAEPRVASQGASGQGQGAGVPALVDGEEFVLSRAGGFRLERASELRRVRQLLAEGCSGGENRCDGGASAEPHTPLLLLAASGMGKSTLLAQMVQAVRKEDLYDVVHAVFVGSVERSSDALAVGVCVCVCVCV